MNSFVAVVALIGCFVGSEIAPTVEGMTELPSENTAVASSLPTMELSNANNRYWVEADYLLFWRKPICLKTPVITLGSPTDPVPGAIGQPNTQVVVGDTRDEFGGASGIRPILGMNLTADGFVAAEVRGFWLQPAVDREFYASSPSGGPNSYLPYREPDNEHQAIPFSTPGVVAGNCDVVGTSFLWGLESNVILRTFNRRSSTALTNSFQFGARYLDLSQSIVITNSQQLVADPSATASGTSSFAMRNQFMGPQFGWTAGFGRGVWFIEATGKIAAGWCYQTNNLQGGPLLTSTSGSALLMPGPLLAEPSNVGIRTSIRPALSPEIDLRLKIELLENVSMTLGYSLIYLNKALCPGDQMNPVLNASQLPGRGPVTGELQPKPIFFETDFFAQGLSAGLEFQF